jgi:hypothetical protein
MFPMPKPHKLANSSVLTSLHLNTNKAITKDPLVHDSSLQTEQKHSDDDEFLSCATRSIMNEVTIMYLCTYSI